MIQENQKSAGKFKSFFIEPKVFFSENKKKNPWLLTFLLIVVSTAILQGKTISVATNAVNVSAGGGQDVTKLVSKMSMVFGIVTGSLGSVINVFLTSLVILLCVKYIFKSEVKYREVLSVYCLSSIPIIILNIINYIIYSNISELSMSSDLIIILIRKINPLTIWFFVLLVIGISVVSKISIKKSIILFVVFTFLSLTFTVGSYYISAGLKNNTGQIQLNTTK